jgi:hypothetical protein
MLGVQHRVVLEYRPQSGQDSKPEAPASGRSGKVSQPAEAGGALRPDLGALFCPDHETVEVGGGNRAVLVLPEKLRSIFLGLRFSHWQTKLMLSSPYVDLRKHGHEVTLAPEFGNLLFLMTYLCDPGSYEKGIARALSIAGENAERLRRFLESAPSEAAGSRRVAKSRKKAEAAGAGADEDAAADKDTVVGWAEALYRQLSLGWRLLLNDPLDDPLYFKLLHCSDPQGLVREVAKTTQELRHRVEESRDLAPEQIQGAVRELLGTVQRSLKAATELLAEFRAEISNDGARYQLPRQLDLAQHECVPCIAEFQQAWQSGRLRVLFAPLAMQWCKENKARLAPLVFNGLATEYRLYCENRRRLAHSATGHPLGNRALLLLPYFIVDPDEPTVFYIGYLPLWADLQPDMVGKMDLSILFADEVAGLLDNYVVQGLIMRTRLNLRSLNVYSVGARETDVVRIRSDRQGFVALKSGK